MTYTDRELLYSATARCQCGSGLAYPMDREAGRAISAWVCARALRGEVPESAVQAPPFMGQVVRAEGRHDAFPWVCWKIREETSINNTGGWSTRPAGTIARTVGRATCGACNRTWESEPYAAPGLSHHWHPGACPGCGNDCGGGGVWSSDDKRPRIETRYRDVVLDASPLAALDREPAPEPAGEG